MKYFHLQKLGRPLAAIFTFLTGLLFIWITSIDTTEREIATVAPLSTQYEEPVAKISSVQFSHDPFALERFVNEKGDDFNVLELWSFLSIDSRMKLLYNPSIEIPGESIFSSCPSCKAEIQKFNLDDDKESEVLLSVSSYGGFGDFRLLVFDKVNGNWKLTGFTDHNINKYYSPIIRTIRFGSDKFLTLTCLGGSGTGIRISFERWYQLIDGGLVEVLSFPNESFTSMTSADLQQNSTAKVKGHFLSGEKAYFNVDFRIRFTGYMDNCGKARKDYSLDEVDIFSSRKNGTFVKQESGRYALDESISSISNSEIYTAYVPWGVSPKEFRSLYPSETSFVLGERSSCRARWLKNWLSQDWPSE